MKNLFSVLLTLALVVLLGFLIFKLTAKELDHAQLDQPREEVADEVVLPDGYEKYMDKENGFSISFPKTTDDPLEEDAELPAAAGEKSRKFSLEVLKMNDERLNADYCYTSPTGGKGKKKAVTIGGHTFCLTDLSDAGAGSVFRTYAYTAELKDTVLLTSFYIRYPTDIRLYEGCEKTEDATTELCKNLAFDETRDTELFKDILKTLVIY
jgi:hypothetical protein